MAEKIILGDNSDEVSKILESYLQSSYVSFLIGSGASMPAIQVAGSIEAEINELIEADELVEANLKAISFIEEIEKKHFAISIGIEDEETAQTHSNYVEFLTALDLLLFQRKNILLPRQANIFTTNYDFFIEHAASQLPSLLLNDRFDRGSAVETNFPWMGSNL